LLIKIREIPESGLELVQPLGRSLLHDALTGLDADLERSRGEAKLVLTKSDGNVFLDGKIVGETWVPCVRCLAEVKTAIEAPLRMVFTPEDEAPEDDEAEEDVEHGTHDGVAIELDDVLREALILAVPLNPLCRPECKGLCPVCGGDRNARDCACAVKFEDPRLAPLKGLKL